MSNEETSEPKYGALVRDTRRERVGVLMDRRGQRLYLRPQGGGCEWEADSDAVEELTPEEALSAKVAEANRRSEEGL